MATETNGWTSVQCQVEAGEFEVGVSGVYQIMLTGIDENSTEAVAAILSPEDARAFAAALVRAADEVEGR